MKEKTLLGTMYGRGITIETDEIVTKEMVLKAFASILKRRDEYEEALKIDIEIMGVLGKEPKTVLSVLNKIFYGLFKTTK